MGPFKRLWGFAHTLVVSYLLMLWRVCWSIRRWEGPRLTRCPWLIALQKRRGDETCKCACLPFRSPTSPNRILPSHNRAVLQDGNNQQQSGTCLNRNRRERGCWRAAILDNWFKQSCVTTFYLIWTNSISLAVWLLKNLNQWNFKCSSQKKSHLALQLPLL